MGQAGDATDLYQQAVQIVTRDKKASTSYIQRRLQIGYNRAASIMERMEQEGVVGQANHAGKREILLGRDAPRFVRPRRLTTAGSRAPISPRSARLTDCRALDGRSLGALWVCGNSRRVSRLSKLLCVRIAFAIFHHGE